MKGSYDVHPGLASTAGTGDGKLAFMDPDRLVPALHYGLTRCIIPDNIAIGVS